MRITDLRPLSDEESAEVQRLHTLDICPTCKTRRKRDWGESWDSPGYKLDGQIQPCDCEMQVALFARYFLSGLGTQYMRLDWDDFSGTKEADQWVRDYIKNWPGMLLHGFGLTFASKVQGVGKTWAASHIAKELAKQGRRVYFLDFVTMVDAFCDRENRRMIEDRMRETTLLILDDVRAGISERQSDLYALAFEAIIRHRTNFDLPSIFTTNLTQEEFEREFPRIYSLIAPKQRWINMNGKDYRKLSDTAEATAVMIAAGEVRPIT